MADWGADSYDVESFEHVGITASVSSGTAVAAGSHSKGAWCQLVASTARLGFPILTIKPVQYENFLVDLAIGGAGAEQLVAENLRAHVGSPRPSQMFLPVPIPAGSRIAARAQKTTADSLMRAAVLLCSQGLAGSVAPGRKIISHGENLSDETGTLINAGGTANTKGSWTQLVASTSAPYTGLLWAPVHSPTSNSSSPEYLIDIGIGGAGSEQVLIPDLLAGREQWTGGAVHPTTPMFIPCKVPAGSRIAARVASTTTDATDRSLDVIVWGVA